MPAAVFARSLAAATIRKANSTCTAAGESSGRLSFQTIRLYTRFHHGLLPGASIAIPIQPGEIEGSGNWAPGNSDGTYGGIQPASYGLIHLRNTMSARRPIAGLIRSKRLRRH